MRSLHLFLVVVCISGFIPAEGADIYWTRGRDGSMSFASEKMDSSYEMFQAREPLKADLGTRRGSSARAGSKEAHFIAAVKSIATKHGVDADLVMSIIHVESGFNPSARSIKGAVGLMQLMPSTAASYGVTHISDPLQNIDGGTRYLKELLDRTGGNVPLAVAAYNAGRGAVEKHGWRIPPYRETMLFVPAVLAKLQAIRSASLPYAPNYKD